MIKAVGAVGLAAISFCWGCSIDEETPAECRERLFIAFAAAQSANSRAAADSLPVLARFNDLRILLFSLGLHTPRCNHVRHNCRI